METNSNVNANANAISIAIATFVDEILANHDFATKEEVVTRDNVKVLISDAISEFDESDALADLREEVACCVKDGDLESEVEHIVDRMDFVKSDYLNDEIEDIISRATVNLVSEDDLIDALETNQEDIAKVVLGSDGIKALETLMLGLSESNDKLREDLVATTNRLTNLEDKFASLLRTIRVAGDHLASVG